MKAIILARVSTEEQKEAGNSLPAQVARLENYCRQKGFQIAKKYSFDESAYKTKRDDFDKILEYLNSTKEKMAVCFDKVDRFSRNVFDKRVARLYDLAMADQVELHFVSDNLVITPHISAAEKFHFGINLGLAKYYSDAISDNIKRAYEQKKRNGEWIGKAPIGYLNIADKNGNKDILPDPERAHFIQQIFYLYAQGNNSIRTLAEKLKKDGFKSTQGKPIASSMIEHILKNPFYYGIMRIKNKLYPHKYKLLINEDIFKKAEAVRLGWAKKPFKYAAKPFALRGLIKCAKCGGTITGEIAKGKYVYYSCKNFKGACKRIWIREEKLLNPIYRVLKSLQLGEKRINDLTEKLKKLNESKIVYHNLALDGLNDEYRKHQQRIDNLLDLRLDGSITKDEYDKKLKELKEKQQDILLQIEDHTNADENFYLTANKVLSLAQRACDIFESSEPNEKRQLLNFLLLIFLFIDLGFLMGKGLKRLGDSFKKSINCLFLKFI